MTKITVHYYAHTGSCPYKSIAVDVVSINDIADGAGRDNVLIEIVYPKGMSGGHAVKAYQPERSRWLRRDASGEIWERLRAAE